MACHAADWPDRLSHIPREDGILRLNEECRGPARHLNLENSVVPEVLDQRFNLSRLYGNVFQLLKGRFKALQQLRSPMTFYDQHPLYLLRSKYIIIAEY